MKRWLFFLGHWSWLFTLPLIIVFFCWGEATIERYYTFGVRYNSAPFKMSLLQSGKREASHMLRKLSLATFPKMQKTRDGVCLKTINVFVSKSNLAQLNSNLPHSGFKYVRGMLLNNGKLQKVKVKYRGDFLPHWGFFKKSLRIKTKKKSLFEGMRAFNVIAPKGVFPLHNYLGYRLASYLDLIAPRSEMVNLNLNGENQGLHILVEQLEELTLRYNGRMPGDLYVGELIGKDAYTEINLNVFEHPGLWKKIAINNHYPEGSRKPLETLINIINAPPSAKTQAELSKILDMSAWGRFSAFETLTQTFHYDQQHNWRLYYDPMRSKFEPIIWDPLPWTANRGEGKIPHPDMIRTILHRALFRNGDFLLARHKALEDFFSRGLDKQFLAEVDQILERVKPAIKADPNLRFPQTKIEKRMPIVQSSISSVFDGIRNFYCGENGNVTFASIPQGIDISITGRRPVRLTSIRYLHSLGGNISATLHYWVDGVEFQKDVSGGLSIHNSQLDLEIPLMARMQFLAGKKDIKNRLDVQPSYFKIIINGISPENRLLEVYVDRGQKDLEMVQQVAKLVKKSFHDSYLIMHAKPKSQPLVWQGIVNIEGQEVVEKELIILPGTTIYLAPGASLILQNRLIAEGTVDQPILFMPASREQEPWGAVVIKGDEANGSRLKYCEFVNGSGLKSDLVEYTAMFSLHDVKRVDIINCLFRDSLLTDDMVHAVYSELKFRDCTFERSLSDALDVDISQVVIDRCRFSTSGNDAIDLMASKAVITDTIVQKSGDKAVSVGEGSTLLALNDHFRQNSIGIQVKDGSVAALYNISFIDNAHALDAYKKNWRYGRGGQIFLYKGQLLKNEKMITADKKSLIKVFDSFIDKPVKAKKKRVKLDSTVGMVHKNLASSKKLKRFPEEIDIMKDFDEEYWNRIDSGRRGASQIAFP